MKTSFTLFLGAALSLPWLAIAGEFSGYVGIEGRGFVNAPLYPGQNDGVGVTAIFEPEFYHDWQDGDVAFNAKPYLRWDSLDGERSLFDLRELSILWIQGDWETKVGVSKVFWGVTESQHLVDVINQTDLVAGPDGEEKLGQPMVQLVRVSDWGDFSLFVLPGFRERTFPGEEGRLRPGVWVDTDAASYESSKGARRTDFAFRWKNSIGDYDIGLHYFSGTSREPILRPKVDANEALVLAPHYELMNQIGLDLQLTRGGWLWKLEAIGRESDSGRFSAMAGGIEYTLYGLFGSAVDFGLLTELHLDSRGNEATSAFNHDLFAGGRLTWNDDADTSLIAGAFVDYESGATIGRIEFQRRLRGSYKLEIELQTMSDIDERDLLYPLRRDGYLQAALSRYF